MYPLEKIFQSIYNYSVALCRRDYISEKQDERELSVMKKNGFTEAMRTFAETGGIIGFGISVLTPLLACVFFAVWLYEKKGVGEWVIIVGLVVGLISSACGFYRSLKAYTDNEKKAEEKKMTEFEEANKRPRSGKGDGT